VRGLRERLAFLHATDPAWPDVSDAALARSAADWLGPFIAGSGGRLDRIDLGEALLARVDWALRQRIDELAPTHLEVPSGSRVRIDYTDARGPVLAARIQELFGWTETPRLAGGRVPLTIHLLSPARRPVQVTRDLASFWGAGYFDVRKDLRGRYPKHFWPDDPLTAAARRGVRG
jgi:ATP-dependent helicase HrpB